MKVHLGSRGPLAALALALAVGPAASQATLPMATELPAGTHARISVHRHDNGDVKRGARNEIETSNWSGYVIANFATGGTYTAAQATWKVPAVSYAKPPPVCHTVRFGSRVSEFCRGSSPQWEYSSSWVGIGGYCENSACTAVDNTLIQLGTEQDASRFGATEYYAWIEVLPNNPILISPSYPNCDSLSCAYPVRPGDAITASLTCVADCMPGGASQTWTLKMSNETEAWSFSTNIAYASSLLSADWIEEAPSSSAGILPLANYATVSFDPTVGSGAAPGFASAAGNPDAILMVDPYGETSAPSTAETGPDVFIDAFNTCWGNNPNNIAACAAP
jgi:hypothetical protein